MKITNTYYYEYFFIEQNFPVNFKINKKIDELVWVLKGSFNTDWHRSLPIDNTANSETQNEKGDILALHN